MSSLMVYNAAMKSAHESAWKQLEPVDAVHWLQLQTANYLRYGRMRKPHFGEPVVLSPRTGRPFSHWLERDRTRFRDYPEGYAPYIDEDLKRNRREELSLALKSSLSKIS